MELITSALRVKIERHIINSLLYSEHLSAAAGISDIIKEMYGAIPQNKRISFGIVHTIKQLGLYLFNAFKEKGIPLFDSAVIIFDLEGNSESRAVALCILSYYGLEYPDKVLPYFEKAAADDDWEVREISQMLFRKLIKKHPENMKKFLLKQVKSKDANVRRFVGETLRPVCENKWFYKQPEYSLSVIRHLFRESKAYPRTSIGDNLSDLARHQPELIYKVIKALVANGDKNSYWIAYRACRNLVKKEPERVMKLLGTDRYKYKDRVVVSNKNGNW
jgi:3-methyladenine DNA glycosylase AlkC